MPTVLEPTVDVRVDIAEELLTAPRVERQVTVVLTDFSSSSVYADPEAVLICEQTGARSRLLTCTHLELYPGSTLVRDLPESPCLVFEPLPEDCKSFLLQEPARRWRTPWVVSGIVRNDRDVYPLAV